LKKFILSLPLVQLLVVLYVILAIAAASQAYIQTVKTLPGEPPVVTRYNNYIIFKCSHFHLLEGKDLYKSYYPEEHWDLYKYSPTFALFFGCFAWLPDWLGLSMWNLLNVMVFFIAIRYLPGLNDKKKMWILLLSVADTMISLQNSQSNVLVVGLLILGFGLFETKHYFLATLCIVATFYIKIFGIVALILLVFYPDKRKSMLYTIFWMITLWVVPAIVIGFKPLMATYVNYLDMLKNDQSVSLGISVMGGLKLWFGIDVYKTVLAVTGFMIMCLPLVNYRKFADLSNRILFFSALLIWMVIFNHKAESPTFIIATSGVFIWFFNSKKSIVNLVLLGIVVILTSLSSTDLFPSSIRENFFEPYLIKVVPCILVWIKVLADLSNRIVAGRINIRGNLH
jgi:hypothetical protein